jgi:hypothetical protein
MAGRVFNEAYDLGLCVLQNTPAIVYTFRYFKPILNVRGVGSFIATGDPLLTSISNLRKERKKGNLKYMFKACLI